VVGFLLVEESGSGFGKEQQRFILGDLLLAVRLYPVREHAKTSIRLAFKVATYLTKLKGSGSQLQGSFLTEVSTVDIQVTVFYHRDTWLTWKFQ